MDEFLVHFCCRHPRGWCGLKFILFDQEAHCVGRHPRGWCGLKLVVQLNSCTKPQVATREGGVD